MRRDALLHYSKADLVELVLHQQDEIQRLTQALARLEASAGLAETSAGDTEGVGESGAADALPAPRADPEVEHEAAVHKGLMHLDDLSYLRQSPLIHWLTALPAAGAAGALQALLGQAIDDLQHTDHLPADLRPLMYTIIYSRFIEKRRAVEVMRALALSPRQYFRQQKTAIQAITHLLFDAQR